MITISALFPLVNLLTAAMLLEDLAFHNAGETKVAHYHSHVPAHKTVFRLI